MTELTLGPLWFLTIMAQIIWVLKEEGENGQKAGCVHWRQVNNKTKSKVVFWF